MAFLRNIYINLYSALNKKNILKREIDLLNSRNTDKARLLAGTLASVLHDDAAKEEKEYFTRIEGLRRRLLICHEKIPTIDCGAGNAATKRSPSPGSENITVARAALSSKNHFWGRILFALIRRYKPAYCIELGTNMGISASYQASALMLNKSGRLITLEGAINRAELAKKHLEKLGLKNTAVLIGKFEDTLESVLDKNIPVNYVFIDGHHDEHATFNYFEKILSHCSDNAVIVFDDISWSEGMRRAWKKIAYHPNVDISADLFVMGICITRKQKP